MIMIVVTIIINVIIIFIVIITVANVVIGKLVTVGIAEVSAHWATVHAVRREGRRCTRRSDHGRR